MAPTRRTSSELNGTSPPDRGHLGFTLIEVLITVIILSVGIVLVLQAINASANGLDIARDATTAMIVIKDKVSEVEAASLAGREVSSGWSRGIHDEQGRPYQWEMHIGNAHRYDRSHGVFE